MLMMSMMMTTGFSWTYTSENSFLSAMSGVYCIRCTLRISSYREFFCLVVVHRVFLPTVIFLSSRCIPRISSYREFFCLVVVHRVFRPTVNFSV